MGKVAVRAVVWLDDLVSNITMVLCGSVLTVMVVVAALGVFFRYVLHASLPWADEFNAYLFVWLTCLGAAVGLKKRAHPPVRALADRLPGRAQPLLHAATDCVVIALGLIFVVYGGDMLELMGTETAATIPVSMIYPFLSIPLAGALFILHSLTSLLQLWLAPRRAGAPGEIAPQH
jgi:TRAP-type C4-dicarboxylate transport system permease small subunit